MRNKRIFSPSKEKDYTRSSHRLLPKVFCPYLTLWEDWVKERLFDCFTLFKNVPN